MHLIYLFYIQKHMGFTELMNAPDVDEVQQRE